MKTPHGLCLAVAALAVAALAVAPAATASSGGLDRRGGHHCWTSCAKSGLYTGQYHCHRSPCSSRDVSQHRAHGH